MTVYTVIKYLVGNGYAESIDTLDTFVDYEEAKLVFDKEVNKYKHLSKNNECYNDEAENYFMIIDYETDYRLILIIKSNLLK